MLHTLYRLRLPLALCLLLLAGCGYHTANTATHIPANTRVIDVPIFKNHTQGYHVELTLTEAVLKELQSRTAFKTVSTDDPGEADAVLQGAGSYASQQTVTNDANECRINYFTLVINVKCCSHLSLPRDWRVAFLLTDVNGRVTSVVSLSYPRASQRQQVRSELN